MEEDNALDIIRWLFKDTTQVDLSRHVRLKQNATFNEWEARLRGNLLALRPVEAFTEPLLIVCEKVHVEKLGTQSNTFSLKYGNEELAITCPTEEELDEWILKLSTCSHRMVQAEYDQAMFAHFSQPYTSNDSATKSAAETSTSNSLRNYFLTSLFSKEQTFSICQSASVPNRQIQCRETMYESKLSMVIPNEMVKLLIKWASELRDDLLGQLWAVKNAAIVEALHTAVRHLNSNIEVYTQSAEFLEGYNGGFFRPSTERYRVAFGLVPTNLHVQYFTVNGKEVAHFLTVGAIAAVPLRFSAGGLYKIRNKFLSGLDPAMLDHTNESRFYSRRTTLLNIKRQIGDLSRRLDSEWHVADFGKVDKVGLQIFSELKQIHETLCDVVQAFPNVNNLVDSLCEGGLACLLQKKQDGQHRPRDTLGNQMDQLDAEMISLNSKMAVIDRVDGDQKGRAVFEENTRTSINSALDGLHHLTESLLQSQMLGLVLCFRKQPDCQTFFHLQLRYDMLLSQSLTFVCTALMTELEACAEDLDLNWDILPPLITCFSFLSCYGDEQGMIEDMHDMWGLFPGAVSLRFVLTSSTVSQTCIPQIEGYRTDLKVAIPVHAEMLKKLPKKLADGGWFRVMVAFWNLGINHEASFAASIGSTELEEVVNRTALKQTQQYVERLTISAVNAMDTIELAQKQLIELQNVVHANPSRKNTQIFARVMALTGTLGSVCALACKSGKDRTSMAVTLEEGRALKENWGISQQQMGEVVECLRKKGVRRENCRKNVGKPLYSFSPFQIHFLPAEFRPPNGTYTNAISS